MAHTRHRKFNTGDTYSNQKLDNDLCQAVKAGNTIYLRGQVGTNFEGETIGKLGTTKGDTCHVDVKQLLEEVGSELSHIVKITIFITDRAYREPVYREVGKWLKGVFPVCTGLIVQGLAQPQWVMEIDVIAVIPDDA